MTPRERDQVRALLEERDFCVRRGLPERVAAVDQQLANFGHAQNPPTDDAAPTNDDAPETADMAPAPEHAVPPSPRKRDSNG